MTLSRERIGELLSLLDAELSRNGIEGELFLVGGAVMCLAMQARDSTADVDAVFRPASEVRAAAKHVAQQVDAPATWLNDGVKGFLSAQGDFEPYLELPNLKVHTAHPAYLLAMKCMALRVGEEYSDEDDIRFLLRYLNIETVDQALEVISRYYDPSRLLPKTRLGLEEMFGHRASI